MPRIMYPTNDGERLAQLERILAGISAMAESAQAVRLGMAQPLLSEALHSEIVALIPEMANQLHAIEAQEAVRRRATTAVKQAMQQLQLTVRQQVNALAWAVRIGNDEDAIFRFYGLPLDGALPKSQRRTIWVQLAQTLLARNALAAQRGVPPLVDAPALERAVRTAEAAIAEIQPAKQQLRELQHQMRQARRQAIQLITEVHAQLSYQLRGIPAASRREVMRDYGLRFRPSRREETAPVPATAAAEAPVAEGVVDEVVDTVR
ncbi:MAG: hypothetical protein KDE53_05225 [Caldilineaceae bacterium]|nr:hypothetical protein [Caldilineaceae bacterium]